MFDGFAFVVFVLAPGQGDEKFGVTVVGNEEPDGDNGETLLLDGLVQETQFAFLEQEFAVSQRFVLAPGTPEILGHVHAPDIKLPPQVKIAVRV